MSLVAWNNLYKKGKQDSKWPWSEVVSLVYIYFYQSIKKRKKIKILELGSGYGANIPFFLDLGFNYFGIESSRVAVNLILKRFPSLRGKMIVGDFTKKISHKHKFDLIIDRGSMTHNSTSSIKKAVKIMKKTLKPNGIYICVDWFSTNHGDYLNGKMQEDKYTRKNFVGQFNFYKGIIHFADKKILNFFFKDWHLLQLQEKQVNRIIPKNKTKLAFWTIVARKK